MGMITITTVGSFPERRRAFSAMQSGHAVATQDAIDWLTREVLPCSEAQDKQLREKGHMPEDAFAEYDKRHAAQEPETVE